MRDAGPLDWQAADALSATYGESFFTLDLPTLRSNALELLSQFRRRYPATELAYAYKANPLPAICTELAGLGLMAEVVSQRELELAAWAGLGADRIVFNGPARDATTMLAALRSGALVNLDSLRDVNIAREAAAATPGAEFAVGLRCSLPLPDLPASRFGFDVTGTQFGPAVAGITATPGLRLAGLHCHVADRRVETFNERARGLLAVAAQVMPSGLDYLDLGGNLYGGVPASLPGAHAQPTAADYAQAVCEPLVAAYGTGSDSPTLIMEPGAAIVATSMRFVTRVISVKNNRGRRLATVHGSQLNISPNTRRTDFPVTLLPASAGDLGAGPCDVAGGSPMESDFLALELPLAVGEGDFLVFDRVGAYSVSFAPRTLIPQAPVLTRPTVGQAWYSLPTAAN